MNLPHVPNSWFYLTVSDLLMTWMGVAGNPTLLFPTVGAQTVFCEGLGGTALSLSSPDSGEMVGRSGSAAKGRAPDNTAGMTSLYTELTMLGRNKGSVKTPGTWWL